MEYFIGAAVTLAIVYFVNRFISVRAEEHEELPLVYTQSYVYELIRPFVSIYGYVTEEKQTQATKHFNNLFIKIVFTEDKAYWIEDTTFYVADLSEDGLVQKDTAKQVDTMSMSKVELDDIKVIVEKLTEGTGNDSWNAGK